MYSNHSTFQRWHQCLGRGEVQRQVVLGQWNQLHISHLCITEGPTERCTKGPWHVGAQSTTLSVLSFWETRLGHQLRFKPLNCAPENFMCWSPNSSECDCIWRQSLQRGNGVKMRLPEWALTQYKCYPYLRRGNLATDMDRGKMIWRHKEKTTIYKPKMKPTLQAPWAQTSSLQDYKKAGFCCLSHPVCSTSLWWP